MKTYVATAADLKENKKWYVVDADGVVLGRLAAEVARRLRGKHKPLYTPSAPCGDGIIIINAEKVRLTGNKMEDKEYNRHTGYPGGLKTTTPQAVLSGRHPERVVEMAVRRMLPRGPLGREMFRSMKIYAGPEHEHEAQKPEVLDIAGMNPRNKR